jgi:hypothetical protein
VPVGHAGEQLGAAEVADWGRRITTLLFGPAPTLARRTRAIAVGGLGDCTALLLDVPSPTSRPPSWTPSAPSHRGGSRGVYALRPRGGAAGFGSPAR